MASLTLPDLAWIDVGAAARTLPGERDSGDRALARLLGDGLLVAAIDGLGHGSAAAEAAEQAAAAIDDAPAGSGLRDLLERCHRRVRKTRGVVLSLALFDPAEQCLHWAGVGDVEAVLVRAGTERRDTLALRPGVVGQRLPPYRRTSLPLGAGDTLVLATDGLRRGLAGELPRAAGAADAAERLLAAGATGEDDALVVVARYLGREAR